MNGAMEQMLQQAERDGKWVHCNYQDLWWSPAELRLKQADGQFCWGVRNFELRDPQEQVKYLEKQIKKAQDELNRFLARLKASTAEEQA